LELVFESRWHRSSLADAKPFGSAVGFVQNAFQRAKAGVANVLHPYVDRGAGVAAAFLDFAFPDAFDAIAVVAILVFAVSAVSDLRFGLDAVVEAFGVRVDDHFLLTSRHAPRRGGWRAPGGGGGEEEKEERDEDDASAEG